MSYQVLARKWRPTHVRRARRAGARRHGADERARPRTAAPRVPAHGHARRRQDDAGADSREKPELRNRRHRDALRRVQRVPGHRRRALRRLAGARCRIEYRRRQHARNPRQRALFADGRALQGVPDRRGAHAVEGRVQLDAEDARGAARAREVRARDDRSAEDPGNRAVALSPIQPDATAARRDRGATRAHPGRGNDRRRRGCAARRSLRAAQGSLRDALSLLDQAIAYGGGDVREAACGRCSASSTANTCTGSSMR